MGSYYPVTFGGYRPCVSGEMFLVVEEQDFTFSFKSAINVYL